MDRLWVLDFEASGLSSMSYPIEVGLVSKGIEYQALIQPEPDWNYWNTDAESVHGISRDLILSEGLPAITVAEKMAEVIDSTIVYSDCARWDSFWLTVLMEAAGVSVEFTVQDISQLLSECEQERYCSAHNEVAGMVGHTPHRALDDARAIYNALQAAKGVR